MDNFMNNHPIIAGLIGAVGFYGFLWLTLAIGTMAGL